MSSLPSTIKAIGIHQHGDLDAIQELQIPFPEQKDDEVLIKVEYSGVNFIDTYERAGIYPTSNFPKILGQEASGTIVRLPTSPAVLNNTEYQLRELSVGVKVATVSTGTFAEYISIPWAKVTKLPDNLDAKYGAAAVLQGLTALTFSKEAYEIKKGDFILIYSAAGGVGSILTQIAVHLGATVIATVSSDAKAKVVAALGAQHIINTSQQDVIEEVLKITNGEGVHGIFDGIGKDTFDGNFRIARRKGTIVTYGNSSGVVPPFSPLRLVEKNLKITRPKLGNYIFTPEEIRTYTTELFSLLASGVVKLAIHEEYPFTAAGVQKSQRDISSRGTMGKLVIHVSS
ncbi:hypothetical protein FRB99_006709 [Tulasnella sp. 403]|nr:hypothetical protein FRB99_006709 [Tulasnella sp. 403]